MKIKYLFLSIITIYSFLIWSIPEESVDRFNENTLLLVNDNMHPNHYPRDTQIHAQQVQDYITTINQHTYSGRVPLIPIVAGTLIPFTASIVGFLYCGSLYNDDSCTMPRGAVYGSFAALMVTNGIILVDHMYKVRNGLLMKRLLQVDHD